MIPDGAVSLYRTFRAHPTRAWAHLTRPDLLALWLGSAELELLEGGEAVIELWNGDVVRGTVTAAVPPVRLELRARASLLSPESRITMALEGDGPGCRVTVAQDGLRSDPERRAARQLWSEAFQALRTALQDGTDAHEWGSGIPVAIRALLPRSAGDLWPLISTASGIGKWIANVERFDCEPGAAFRLRSRFQGRPVIEEGVVEEATPETRVALSWEWAGEGWGAATRVEFSIDPEPSGCSLLVHHSGFDRVAPERRVAARRNYAAAWPEVLADLKRLVAPVTV